MTVKKSYIMYIEEIYNDNSPVSDNKKCVLVDMTRIPEFGSYFIFSVFVYWNSFL